MSNEQEFLVEIRENMQKSVDSFGRDLNTVRTGRAVSYTHLTLPTIYSV